MTETEKVNETEDLNVGSMIIGCLFAWILFNTGCLTAMFIGYDFPGTITQRAEYSAAFFLFFVILGIIGNIYNTRSKKEEESI